MPNTKPAVLNPPISTEGIGGFYVVKILFKIRVK